MSKKITMVCDACKKYYEESIMILNFPKAVRLCENCADQMLEAHYFPEEFQEKKTKEEGINE